MSGFFFHLLLPGGKKKKYAHRILIKHDDTFQKFAYYLVERRGENVAFHVCSCVCRFPPVGVFLSSFGKFGDISKSLFVSQTVTPDRLRDSQSEAEVYNCSEPLPLPQVYFFYSGSNCCFLFNCASTDSTLGLQLWTVNKSV